MYNEKCLYRAIVQTFFMGTKWVLLVDGKKKLQKLLEETMENENHGYGYYLRPTYTKRGKKKYYYWYRYRWDPVRRNNVAEYVGKTPPPTPQPKPNPLQGVRYQTVGSNLLLPIDVYNKVKHLFKDCKHFLVLDNGSP